MAKTISIGGLRTRYEVARRDVKYPRIELKTGRLVLVMPVDYRDEKGVIRKHREWIYGKLKHLRDVKISSTGIKQVSRGNDGFRHRVKNAVRKYEQKMGVKVKSIYFKHMNSKWGSCSSKGNITINNLMSKLPARLIDYVICHELCHLRHRRHDAKFFETIGKYFRDYEKMKTQLAQYWFVVNKRG